MIYVKEYILSFIITCANSTLYNGKTIEIFLTRLASIVYLSTSCELTSRFRMNRK